LDAWAGDGLLLDDVFAWYAPSLTSSNSVDLRGVVRDLTLLENNATLLWSLVSGPGTVSFNDAASLETTATFSLPGDYTLRFIVDNGSVQETHNLSVTASAEGGSGVSIAFMATLQESLDQASWTNTDQSVEWIVPATYTSRFFRVQLAL